ncbi:MBL fold metallo-hydrolase [Kitasatospora sp. MMS16-BH015]|uniref:MBL fold metallo-hydrolase n=1 Tax=Kitasatospora sp. MMS16-BH015 TaxID=2018025 RepID=UPI000CA36C73|nr:MBL fold metallo-hydrolase [Kitasatospora sp. MMS16-BH015]AUG75531.1 MBL fold metallo-hydrolase [Kitasatospora sp. MMS16-BH015]
MDTQQHGTELDYVTGAPVVGDLAVRWQHGLRSPKSGGEALIQVHAYDEHTYLLRQSKTVSFEAPFLFLLFGNERALLLDTGATADPERFPLRATVDGLIDRWLAEHPREGYELVIAHTHGHGDHVAADGQFADRPRTTVVAREAEAAQEFFGFTDWPGQTVGFDLGGRVLDVFGSPGHHQAAITCYDRWTGLLLTGDTVYPGRLYAADFPAFVATLDRMVEFAEAHPVSHVLGCHVEMSDRPGKDYPIGASYQPRELPLELTVDQLREVRAAARAVADRPGVHRYDFFVLYNGKCTAGQLRLLARGLTHKAAYAVRGLFG